MINLIPPAARASVVWEYWLRVVSVWLLLIGTGCLIVVVLLLPTYVLIRLQVNEMTTNVSAASDKIATYDVSASALITASAQAQVLLSNASTTPFSNYVTQFQTQSGTEVVLREMSFNRTTAGRGTIKLAGVATNRQSLVNFRDIIAADPAFVRVNLPISSLIKDKDLLFVLDITLATNTPTTKL
jgi:hypothetical protein